MCAHLVLGHHLKKTITPLVIETFRAHRIFLIPAVAPATEPTVLLEVPLAAADVNNVVQRPVKTARAKRGGCLPTSTAEPLVA